MNGARGTYPMAIRAPRAMIATPHHLATSTGVRVLEVGGSAVDALIAANAVLGVVYPHWAGPGGDGFWLVFDPRDSSLHALNASGPAAALATQDQYRALGHDTIPARGAAAALTVPGAVDGWRMAHERFGRLEWADLFADAVRYATEGVGAARSLAYWAARDAATLREHGSVAHLVLRDGRPVRADERVEQPELARTLHRIARNGARAGFYEGEIAGVICAALGPGGSPLRPADFASFEAEWVQPLTTVYRGHTVAELPPNTQGFAALQILRLLEGYDVRGWSTADYVHHAAESAKLAFADRDAWLADPRFVDAPVDRLLSSEYADARRARIRREAALPFDVEPGVPFAAAARRHRPEGDTCAFCGVDADGLVVSAIQSLYQDFGSMAMGGATGVMLQNRGITFSLDERAANRLEPGKRPFHTLIPALLLEDGDPVLAFGTMGGNGQPQTHAALVTRILDFGLDVQQAIAAPRWVAGHTLGRTEPRLYLEGRFDDAVARELLARGHDVRMGLDWDEEMGHAQVIRIDRRSGLLEGGADPRGDGVALGY